MDVLYYLKELLENHNTISIDGLGTLYKKKSPGKYDLEKHEFVPPKNSVGFNSELNDVNELAKYVAIAESTTIENAQVHVIQFVEKIQSSLKTGQDVTLNGIGNFTIVDDHLIFKAADDNIFGNEFYGLPTFSDKPHLANTEEKKLSAKEESVVDLKEDKTEATAGFLDNTLITTDIEKQDPKIVNKTIENYEEEDVDFDNGKKNSASIWLKLILALAVITVIFGTAYILKPELFDRILNTNNQKHEEAELVAPLDTIAYESDTLKKDSIPNLDSTVVLIPTTKQIDSNTTTYEVIGSAEKSQKRIDQYILIMQKRGIEAKAIETVPGKLIKISLGSFTDFSFAKKHQDSLRKKLNNPEIYIQTIKPKR